MAVIWPLVTIKFLTFLRNHLQRFLSARSALSTLTHTGENNADIKLGTSKLAKG